MNYELLLKQDELVFKPLGINFTYNELVALAHQFNEDAKLFLNGCLGLMKC